jgi:hypothetical protein
MPNQQRERVLLATGDRACEAYTAIAWGVGLSHERSDVAGAESLYSLEGNMCGIAKGETQADIARTYNVDATTIGRLEPRPFEREGANVAG